MTSKELPSNNTVKTFAAFFHGQIAAAFDRHPAAVSNPFNFPVYGGPIDAAFKDIDEADEIAVHVGLRVRQRVADSCLGRQMNDRVKSVISVPSRPYQELRVREDSPRLPRGYLSIFPLILARNKKFQRLMTAELERCALGPFAPEPAAEGSHPTPG